MTRTNLKPTYQHLAEKGDHQTPLPPPAGSLVGFIKSCSDVYLAVFAPDRTGALFYFSSETVPAAIKAEYIADHCRRGSCGGTFRHSMRVKQHAGKSQAEINRAISRHFFRVSNETMDDPFLNAPLDDDDNSLVTFQTGSQDELDRLVWIFVQSDPAAPAGEKVTVDIQGLNRNYRREIGLYEYSRFKTQRLAILLQYAVQENLPVGEAWSYNDGAHDRRSGYSARPPMISYDIDPPSAHERLEAEGHLRTWLAARPHVAAELAALGSQ